MEEDAVFFRNRNGCSSATSIIATVYRLRYSTSILSILSIESRSGSDFPTDEGSKASSIVESSQSYIKVSQHPKTTHSLVPAGSQTCQNSYTALPQPFSLARLFKVFGLCQRLKFLFVCFFLVSFIHRLCPKIKTQPAPCSWQAQPSLFIIIIICNRNGPANKKQKRQQPKSLAFFQRSKKKMS